MSTFIEILGGLAILAGAFVAVVSIPLIVMMLVAMFTVHLRYGFSAINTIGLTADGPQFGPPGYEVNLLYIAGLLALILGGAGPFVDRWVAHTQKARSCGSTFVIRTIRSNAFSPSPAPPYSRSRNSFRKASSSVWPGASACWSSVSALMGPCRN